MAVDGNPVVNLEGNHPNGGEEVRLSRWKVWGREKWGTRRETGNHPKGTEEVQGVCKLEMGALEREILLQVELHVDEGKDSPEIKQKKRMVRAALTTWKEKTELIKRLKLQRKSEMRSIMNEVYQLVSLYSIFEGVVLTAVATSSRVECEHLWSPVFLSLFAYSMVIFVAFTKFKEIGDLEEKKAINKQKKREIGTQISDVRAGGYDFGRYCQTEWRRMRPRLSKALGLIVPLTIFTTGLVVSFMHILCWS